MTQANERTATLSQMVADEIRVAMTRRRMSGRELATKLGVSPSWISYRLSGKQPIDINDLARIAHALGVGVHELLPAPDVAAQASVSVRNPFVTDRAPSPHVHRPRAREVNRTDGPSGRTDSRRPVSPRRTSRLPRPELS